MLVFIQILVLMMFVVTNCAPIDEEAAVEASIVDIENTPNETPEAASILKDAPAKRRYFLHVKYTFLKSFSSCREKSGARIF